MRYRTLGRTGLEVSQLGFGAMRLPMVGEGPEARVDRERALPMLRRAFELGVNYFDTAVMYCDGDSQRAIGEAFEDCRERIVLSTKNHEYGEDEGAWRRNLEDSLERLRTDRIDVYHHHGVNWQKWTDAMERRVCKWMVRARDEGLVRHIACSFHDNNEGLMKLVGTGYPEVITLQYNLLDRQLAEGIQAAHEAGIGVVVMGPVGGGRLGEPSEVLGSLIEGKSRVPELALRFVLANPAVAVALSGMSEPEHVEENVRVAGDTVSLTERERAEIDEHLHRLDKMARLYCTGCGYCMPCPEGVDIPRIFDQMNKGRVYGLWESARHVYAHIGAAPWDQKKDATACVECGECLDKCPQKILIPAELKEAHEQLGKPAE